MSRPRERAIAGQRFEEDETKCVHVGAGEYLFPFHLLGSHVGGSPDGVRGASQRGRIREMGNAEVAQPGVSMPVEHHVRWLHVSMNDTLAVDIGESGGELLADVAGLTGIERTFGEPGRESRPIDQLEHDVEVLALFAGIEHRHETRMGQSRQHRGFPVEATSVKRRSPAMNLDCDSPVQHLVVGGEH